MGDPLDIRLSNDILYVIRFQDDGFVLWKPLSWKRYKQYRNIALANPDLMYEIEDRVFEECVLEHNYLDISYSPAGVVTTTANLIMHFSGFATPERFEEALEEKRKDILSIEKQIPVLISRTFPSYSLSDIEEMPFDKISELLVAIEQITQEPLSVEKPKKDKGSVNMSKDMASGQVVSSKPPSSKPVHGIDFNAENKALEQFDKSLPAGKTLRDRPSNWDDADKPAPQNFKKEWTQQKQQKRKRIVRRG